MTNDRNDPTSVDTLDTTGLPHGLRWGIKSSFVEYVLRMPDGAGSATDGAVAVGENDLFFSFDADGSTIIGDRVVWSFRGDVRFRGHFGMLFVRVANPRLEVSGGAVDLTIADPDDETGQQRILLATATIARATSDGGTEVWVSDDVVLAASGVAVFGEVYPAGEAFDPWVVQLPRSAGVP